MMNTDEGANPERDEFERALSQARSRVLDHAGRHRTRGVPLRITAIAIGGLVIFGGGVSLGSAMVTPASVTQTQAFHTLKVFCFASPQSLVAFAYVNVSVAPNAPDGSPSANCGRVWDESSTQSALRASALVTEQQYEQGVCTGGGTRGCLQSLVTPPPFAPKPANWADCAIRGGYFVEVGYSKGTQSAACNAQSLSTR